MFFVHWSNDEVTYRNMESTQMECQRCQSEQKNTFRFYEKRTKRYSSISIGSDKSVTVICHGCLLESPLEKGFEREQITKFLKRIICSESFELYEHGKYDKALKQFKKVLKEDQDHPTALYGLTKCCLHKDDMMKQEDLLIICHHSSQNIQKLKS